MWLCNWEAEFSILFNLINLNVSSHKWLVATVLDSLGLDTKLKVPRFNWFSFLSWVWMTVEGHNTILVAVMTWWADLSPPPLSSCVTPNPEPRLWVYHLPWALVIMVTHSQACGKHWAYEPRGAACTEECPISGGHSFFHSQFNELHYSALKQQQQQTHVLKLLTMIHQLQNSS